MADSRRLTADRFFGGTDRLTILKQFLGYLGGENRSMSDAVEWLIKNTRASSPKTIKRHLSFLETIDVIENTGGTLLPGRTGRQFLETDEPRVLFDTLHENVAGFETILDALQSAPLDDEALMAVLNERGPHDMKSPGVARRHREWLAVLGYVKADDGVVRLTDAGVALCNDLQRASGQDRTSTTTDRSSTPPGESTSVSELFNQAKQATPTTTGTSTVERQQYSRRDAVREFALADADGVCQGCGSDAPFLDKDGEPYLEVHHLYRRADGGADDPENVLAICPNCHRRVHYGQNGQAYNAELREIAEERNAKL